MVHPPGIEPGRLAARDFKSLASTNFAMGAGQWLAEAVGFEPTKGANPCRFSRPVPSTTRPRFRFVSTVMVPRQESPGRGHERRAAGLDIQIGTASCRES